MLGFNQSVFIIKVMTSDDEAVASRLVRRPTVYMFFAGVIQSPVINKLHAYHEHFTTL